MTLTDFEQKENLVASIKEERKKFWIYTCLFIFCMLICAVSGAIVIILAGTITNKTLEVNEVEALLVEFVSYAYTTTQTVILFTLLGVASLVGFFMFLKKHGNYDNKIFVNRFTLEAIEKKMENSISFSS